MEFHNCPWKNVLQVLEDYGQPNHILFLYHGFTLENNHHDCVRIDLEIMNIPGSRVPLYPGTSEFQSLMRQLRTFGFNYVEYTSCIRAGSPRLGRLLQFVSIKHGFSYTFPHLHIDTCLALRKELTHRIVLYDSRRHISDHAAWILLSNEVDYLRALRDELNDILEYNSFLSLKR